MVCEVDLKVMVSEDVCIYDIKYIYVELMCVCFFRFRWFICNSLIDLLV